MLLEAGAPSLRAAEEEDEEEEDSRPGLMSCSLKRQTARAAARACPEGSLRERAARARGPTRRGGSTEDPAPASGRLASIDCVKQGEGRSRKEEEEREKEDGGQDSVLPAASDGVCRRSNLHGQKERVDKR